MMMRNKNYIKSFIALVLCLFMVACGGSDDGPSGPIVGGPTGGDDGGGTGGNTDDPYIYTASANLKDVVNFPVGNIVSASKLTSNATVNVTFKEILKKEYNSITAENDMKMRNIFTAPDTYDFSDGDVIVAYAKANGVRVHGHTLIWHSSIPTWLLSFSGTDEEFSAQIENYIKATVTHFAQQKMTVNGQEVSVVESWDVVNEAFETTAQNANFFRSHLGSDFVAKCFQWAREADPDVKLFYNDFNIAGEPSKRSQILNMVNGFITNNVPIDGIGMQMHLNHNWPTTDLPTALQQVTNTGLLVHISELDIKVNYNNDVTEFTEERAAAQEKQYQRVGYYYMDIVPEAQRYGLTIWGFRDQDSWVYNNGQDWPLLYDNDYKYKIAHRGLVNGLKGEAVQ